MRSVNDQVRRTWSAKNLDIVCWCRPSSLSASFALTIRPKVRSSVRTYKSCGEEGYISKECAELRWIENVECKEK